MTINMDRFKIHELRAALLSELKEFIPKGSYSNIHSDEDIYASDHYLALRLRVSHYRDPKLTPRQYAAIFVLENLATYAYSDYIVLEDVDNAEGITNESIKESNFRSLQVALNHYIEHLNQDKETVLIKNCAFVSSLEANPQPDTQKKANKNITIRTIPESLMPDNNNQFLKVEPSPNDEWMAFDSWDMEMAILLITIGYPVDLKFMIEEMKTWPANASGRDSRNAMLMVYDRGLSIAKSSIAAGKIKDPDTPNNWIIWANGKGYNTDHLNPYKHISGLEQAQLDVKERLLSESNDIETQRLVESTCQNYQEQIEGWERLLSLRGLVKSEPSPSTMTDVDNDKKDKSEILGWLPAIIEMADNLYITQHSIGADPSKKWYAEKIAGQCKTNGICTDKGKRLNADYILRHGLNKWEKPKI